MARKKSELDTYAFQPPFYTSAIGAHAYKIPEEYEATLIDIYTKNTEENPDIHLRDIPKLLEDELNIPTEILPNENQLKSWLITGTDILDFEKWLYNGYFWLLLSKNFENVDMLWNDIWLSLDDKLKNISNSDLRSRKLYVTDVKKLIEIGKLDANAIGMLQTASNGKVYIEFVDFFKLLGRLGVFK
jgi:hypothetical protein